MKICGLRTGTHEKLAELQLQNEPKSLLARTLHVSLMLNMILIDVNELSEIRNLHSSKFGISFRNVQKADKRKEKAKGFFSPNRLK
jgi:hypothetical protein